MITNFKILLSILGFIQCSIPKADVEFKLLNEELYFSPIFSNQIGGIEMLYEDYITKNDKEKAKNLIRYEVTNRMCDKILFIPNAEELTYILNIKDDFKQYLLSYSITKEDGEDIDYFFSISPSENHLIYQSNFTRDSMEWAHDTIKYESIYDRKRFKDFIYLEPNETKTFEIELDLPIVKGSNDPAPEALPLYKEEDYLFQLHYIQDKTRLERELPEQILDYLNINNVKIIDLSLHSNIIKLNARF